MKKVVGEPLPFGVSVRNEIVNFSIIVEDGKKCSLCLFEKGAEFPKAEIVLSEEDGVGEVRFVAISKTDLQGMEYCYKIDGSYVLEPYVKKIVDTKYGRRGTVFMDDYDWEGDKQLQIPYHEVIAYNMHVRGFTKHASSKVKKKGTFAGVVEKIPYLKALGVNQIQCMPVYAFEENERYKNYWGYGDAFCFAIKEGYAAGVDAGTELKDMIKACHNGGMEVVLNLPFTAETSKQMIVDCLRYYVMEYHVDGFVLNPYNAPMELIHEDAILKNTKILQNRDDFQNVMRRFLKGDGDMVSAVKWWLSKKTEETGSYNYITNHTGFTLTDLVSYNEKHNEENGEENQDGPMENFSWNCGEEGSTRKKGILELRRKQKRNAMFLLLMAQGTPCILAGDEFGNTQDGNNNVYCQDNEVAWLDWKRLEKEEEFFQYVKKLIALRKAHPILHAEKPLKGTDQIGYGVPDVSYHGESAWRPQFDSNSRQLGIYYHGADGTDLFIAYNMHYEEKRFALPTLPNNKEWHLVISTASEVNEDVTSERQIIIDPRTILMFEGR